MKENKLTELLLRPDGDSKMKPCILLRGSQLLMNSQEIPFFMVDTPL